MALKSLDSTVGISLSSRLRPYKRGSIVIGSDTYIAFRTLLYTRDERTGGQGMAPATS